MPLNEGLPGRVLWCGTAADGLGPTGGREFVSMHFSLCFVSGGGDWTAVEHFVMLPGKNKANDREVNVWMGEGRENKQAPISRPLRQLQSCGV